MATDDMPEVMLDSSKLDETIADPLMAIEREVLAKLREHDVAVTALRDDISGLRQRSASGAASMAELRRVVKEADRVEGLLDSPKEVLARSSIVEAGWPAPDLVQARKVLGAVDACEAATNAARDQIRAEDSSGDGEGVDVLCGALLNLLETWARLQSIEVEMTSTDLPANKVDLMMEGRKNAISPLCAALMDKAEGVYTSLKSRKLDAGDRASEATSALQNFLQKLRQEDMPRRALQSLEVEVPVLDDSATDRLTSRVSEDAVSPGRTAGDVAAAAQAAVNAAVQAINTQADKTSTPQQRLVSPFAIESSVGPEVDLMKSSSPPTGSRATTGPNSVPASSSQRYIVPSGSAELWHAVHVGDEAAIRRFMSAGACNGTLRDASGHSVLWHSIAFNHIGLGNLMFDTYPPGSERGVEVTETHQRKGDTLLHLLCQSKSFSADTATLFKKIAASLPEEIFFRVNQAGHTFFQIAASQLNFWVLTFVLKNFQTPAMALVRMKDRAPFKNMAEALPQPSAPEFSEPAAFPDHFHVADMLQQDESGAVPYADVAFDVGPDSGGSATGRFLAHRIIVASESPVLMEELSKLPLTLLPREQVQAAVFRVDPRISKEVWRSILQFMYTGVINFTFNSDVQKVVELLRACVAYQLPKPLLDYAQSCLYPLLPNSSPEVALQVFSICAGAASSDVDLSSAREASTYILLRSAHKLFEETDENEACQILEKVVESVEKAVFEPKAKTRAASQTEAPKHTAPDAAMNQSVGMAQGTQMPQGAGMDAMAQSMSSTQGPSYGYPDMMKQSMRGYPDMMAQSMMMQSMQGSPDAMSQTRRVPPEMMAQMMQNTSDMMMHSMHGSPDMMSQSRRSPADMMSQDVMAQGMRGHPDMLMQNSQSPQDVMAQGMRGHQDMLMQSSQSPQDMMAQSMRGHQDMLMQSTQGPQDMMAQSMRGRQDMLMQSSRGPQDMSAQQMQAYQDMLMQSTRTPQDMMSQSMRNSQDMLAQSMPGHQDMLMQSSRAPQDMLSQSMRNPQDMLTQSMPGHQDMLMQSSRAPQDMLSQSMRNPQERMREEKDKFLAKMQDPRMQMMQDPRLQMMQNSGQAEQSYPQGMQGMQMGQQQMQREAQMYAQAQAMSQQGMQPGQHMDWQAAGHMQGPSGMMAPYS